MYFFIFLNIYFIYLVFSCKKIIIIEFFELFVFLEKLLKLLFYGFKQSLNNNIKY